MGFSYKWAVCVRRTGVKRSMPAHIDQLFSAARRQAVRDICDCVVGTGICVLPLTLVLRNEWLGRVFGEADSCSIGRGWCRGWCNTGLLCLDCRE